MNILFKSIFHKLQISKFNIKRIHTSSFPALCFNFCQRHSFQNENMKNNVIPNYNYLTSFLPQDFQSLLTQFGQMDYHQMMQQIIEQQKKEQQNHFYSADIKMAQLSLLFCRILILRQEYNEAIDMLYTLNHTISEHYLQQGTGYNNKTEYNLQLTNSLLELSNVYALIGDKIQQQENLQLAEEQNIDFLGTPEQRFEITLKFLQSYRDLDDRTKISEYEQKLVNLFDRINYNQELFPLYKNILSYFIQNHNKQAAYLLGQKLIENYNLNEKQIIESEVIPLISKILPYETNEGKILRELAQKYKLEIKYPSNLRIKIQDNISKISKLKFDNKLDDALQLSNETLEMIMNELPNNIPSDLLLIIFNNLFALNALKNNFQVASEFGEKWIKLSQKLKMPEQIIISSSNVATFYLKHKNYETSSQHIQMALKVLNEYPGCLDETDTFIIKCLQFQINFLNPKTKNEIIGDNLKDIYNSLNKIISQGAVTNLFKSKVIEMHQFVRESQQKSLAKPFALAYFQIKSIMKV